MLLESLKHGDSCFVTLTYKPGLETPTKDCYGPAPEKSTLVKRDVRLFLDRLRKAVLPLKIRYFAVGEYGEENWRPHYHLAIFGLSAEFHGALIDQEWGKGFTFTGTLSKDSAQYIAGYVTKKMTSREDPRLNGRDPEFVTASNGGGRHSSKLGGIGAPAMEDVALLLQNDMGLAHISSVNDVPRELKIGGKSLPLDRYLRSKLRGKVGNPEIFKKIANEKWVHELRVLLEKDKIEAKGDVAEVYRRRISKRNQKALNLESKYKVFKKKESI